MTTRRILYVQYTNPAGYPPLEHSSRILADAGWDVMFLGTGAFGANSLRFAPHARIRVRQLPFCPGGWRQKLHYLWFTLLTLGIIVRWRPSWVYASDLLACPVGLLASFVPGAQVIYHEHDSPSNSNRGGFLAICHSARRFLARRMALGIIPNQGRIQRFQADVSPCKDVVCVWNTPSITEACNARKEAPQDPLRLYYHGNLSAQLLPKTVIDAIALLPTRANLTVVGYETLSNKGYVEALWGHARSLGIDHRLHFVSVMPRAEMLRYCRQQDVGLSLIAPSSGNVNLQHLLGASNKPFDYLACGLALLVPDLPEWRSTYVEPGYGLACNPDDPESIARSVRWFLEHPVEVRAMGERGRRRILEEWNYESQFAPVQTLIGHCAIPTA